MNAKNNSNTLQLTRIYEAPVKLVWQAWVDPQQVAQWWGPRGFTLTTHSKDFRVGGIWHYTMHGPDGTDYPNKTVYHEIKEYERLVYDHGAYDDRPPLFQVTVTFKESQGKTRMDMTMTLPSPEAATETSKFIKAAGGHATWDRLSEYLSDRIAKRQTFVINRSFAAPIETIFEAWTKPEQIAKWVAPKGSEMEFIQADIREGGRSFYVMTNPEFTLYGQTHYLEIKRPNRLVYTQQFCDKDQNISRHPLAPLWPETMLTTVEFTQESENQTRVTVTWECHGAVSNEELAVFIKSRAGMTQGWTGSFDKLDEWIVLKSTDGGESNYMK